MSDLEPVLIGVPCQERMWVKATRSLFRLFSQGIPSGSSLKFVTWGCTIARKRNVAVRATLDGDFGWLLCTDSDMTLAPDTFRRLASHDLPVVSGVCVKRTPPHKICANFLPDTDLALDFPATGQEEPVEVERVGTACLLIRRDVLEAVGPEPFEADPDGRGSDFNFCNLVRDAGFGIYLDPAIRPGHVGAYEYDLSDLAHQVVEGD